ncbi:hypothetical protein PIB30_024264 [Stylosanthes scabra]|uniref:Uncharacterized protein n=1 Tax=Stylosanthes scabra TaxID=79078 RepID=A0ABU6U978_9FABA|nr:hypothetical protein [Stylosanthes scabra]
MFISYPGVDFIDANAKHLILSILLSLTGQFSDVHLSFEEFAAKLCKLMSSPTVSLSASSPTLPNDGQQLPPSTPKEDLISCYHVTRDTGFNSTIVLPVPAGNPTIMFIIDNTRWEHQNIVVTIIWHHH